MNKENYIKEYKGLDIIYREWICNMHAQYINRTKTIYIYDWFFKLKELEQMGTIIHEYWHFIYNIFTISDKLLWIKTSEWDKEKMDFLNLALWTNYTENKFCSKYAEKTNQEEFCECLKFNYMIGEKKPSYKFKNYVDNKIVIAINLKNKYENTL